MFKCDQTIELVENLTGEKPPRRPRRWVGERLPVDYELAVENSHRRQSLTDALNAMGEHQMLAICSMSTHRANGPYSMFMNDYVRYASTLPDVFYNLHVTTAAQNETADWWFTGENWARDSRTEFLILIDEDNSVAQALGVGYCPYALAVDKDGIVRGEDLTGEIELWNGLVNFATGLGDR